MSAIFQKAIDTATVFNRDLMVKFTSLNMLKIDGKAIVSCISPMVMSTQARV